MYAATESGRYRQDRGDYRACYPGCPGMKHRGKIAEPQRYPREVCDQPRVMGLIHNRCEVADQQVVRLQETSDEMPKGQAPHSVSLCVYDELVDSETLVA
ncbi:hypothetical protein PtA15_6A617 [Puccinia triticina]|uniref:MCM OB domain-containing protein n=1 Tax=Puccinia triticina TaxID=208348 RepID=A0ABY7CND0_9BASI|nr:uncharacterized protein PtA15_6A617 [Puccinia triticina]WAQ85987.1 hypothetical protein PtA15_6A617 [Puccinia triticina]WAR55886.1 hypothetical protein PtB15_6B630 [Puccinia triticina]